MKTHRFEDLMLERQSAQEVEAKRQRAAKEALEIDLKQLRELMGKTQVQLAQRTRISQASISKTEQATDHRLSTLRRIIEALGGHLEVTAVFGSRRLRLKGV